MKQILLKLKAFTGTCTKRNIYGFPEGTKFAKTQGDSKNACHYWTIVPWEHKGHRCWRGAQYLSIYPFKLAVQRFENIVPDGAMDQYVVPVDEMLSQFSIKDRVILNIGRTQDGCEHVNCIAKITKVNDIDDVRAVLFWIPTDGPKKTYTTHVDSLNLTSLPGTTRTHKANWALANKTAGKRLWSKVSKWMIALQEDDSTPCPVQLDLDVSGLYQAFVEDNTLMNDSSFLDRLVQIRLSFIKSLGIKPKDLNML